MYVNGWKWMEMFGMAKYGWKGLEWLEMAKNYGLLEITGIHLKQLEITENCYNGLHGQKCLGRLDMAQNTGNGWEWL